MCYFRHLLGRQTAGSETGKAKEKAEGKAKGKAQGRDTMICPSSHSTPAECSAVQYVLSATGL